jgi:hypothetical protein
MSGLFVGFDALIWALMASGSVMIVVGVSGSLIAGSIELVERWKCQYRTSSREYQNAAEIGDFTHSYSLSS